MTDSLAVVSPAPMEGHGAYNRSSRVQAAGLSPAVPLLEQAAKTAALELLPQPVIVADYGSSEGHNSLGPLAVAIRTLRKRAGPGRAIWVVHTDLPDNDFTALFQTLAVDPNSYLHGDSAVFASAIGRSFYEQLLPSSSVTLAWSSWAVQWLSRLPAQIPDQVQIAYSRDPAARAAFARQAAEDWRTFLVHRGCELRPGGKLVVLTMAVDEAGNFGYRPLLEAMYAALLDMVKEGFLRAEEARRMVIPTVGRSRSDFVEPFADSGSFNGLSIEQMEVFLSEDRIWAEFENNGDARGFGAQWAAFSRASVFPTLAAGLETGRAGSRAITFVNRLEADVAARLAASPERMLIPLAKLLLLKQ
ncbi:MAG: SAM-dependent methyltransferase [Verrucomicrobia bacterium]|nr:SAM-dependent methyltransferase [Verrucomicrobiota bacterium]